MTKRKELKAVVNEDQHSYYKSEFAKYGVSLQKAIMNGLDNELAKLIAERGRK